MSTGGSLWQETGRRLGLVLLLALAWPAVASADIIVLKNGREYRGRITAQEKDQVVIQSDGLEWTLQRADIKSMKREARSREAAKQENSSFYQGRIAIYRYKNCPECEQWKPILKKHHTPFDEYDVERDRHAFLAFQEKCQRMRFTVGSYPILEVDGQLMGRGTPGFPEKLARILGHR